MACSPCRVASSMRPFVNTRATSKVRSLVSRPGITSARNVSRIPTAALGRTDWYFPRPRSFLVLFLRMRVNETPHTIREKNIDLARFNERRYFSFAKCRMHHGLAPAIGASAIVWGA